MKCLFVFWTFLLLAEWNSSLDSVNKCRNKLIDLFYTYIYHWMESYFPDFNFLTWIKFRSIWSWPIPNWHRSVLDYFHRLLAKWKVPHKLQSKEWNKFFNKFNFKFQSFWIKMKFTDDSKCDAIEPWSQIGQYPQ